MTIVIERLASRHDRAGFFCGVEALDHYFRTQATQDVRGRVTACFAAIDDARGKVAGYYTLAAGSVFLRDLPQLLAKRLPRYLSIPVARLSRLAVDRSYQGQRLGSVLLWDAVDRAARSELMAYALVVDAKDDAVAGFYKRHGFEHFGSVPLQLILPLVAASATDVGR